MYYLNDFIIIIFYILYKTIRFVLIEIYQNIFVLLKENICHWHSLCILIVIPCLIEQIFS